MPFFSVHQVRYTFSADGIPAYIYHSLMLLVPLTEVTAVQTVVCFIRGFAVIQLVMQKILNDFCFYVLTWSTALISKFISYVCRLFINYQSVNLILLGSGDKLKQQFLLFFYIFFVRQSYIEHTEWHLMFTCIQIKVSELEINCRA